MERYAVFKCRSPLGLQFHPQPTAHSAAHAMRLGAFVSNCLGRMYCIALYKDSYLLQFSYNIAFKHGECGCGFMRRAFGVELTA